MFYKYIKFFRFFWLFIALNQVFSFLVCHQGCESIKPIRDTKKHKTAVVFSGEKLRNAFSYSGGALVLFSGLYLAIKGLCMRQDRLKQEKENRALLEAMEGDGNRVNEVPGRKEVESQEVLDFNKIMISGDLLKNFNPQLKQALREAYGPLCSVLGYPADFEKILLNSTCQRDFKIFVLRSLHKMIVHKEYVLRLKPEVKNKLFDALLHLFREYQNEEKRGVLCPFVGNLALLYEVDVLNVLTKKFSEELDQDLIDRIRVEWPAFGYLKNKVLFLEPKTDWGNCSTSSLKFIQFSQIRVCPEALHFIERYGCGDRFASPREEKSLKEQLIQKIADSGSFTEEGYESVPSCLTLSIQRASNVVEVSSNPIFLISSENMKYSPDFNPEAFCNPEIVHSFVKWGN